MSRIKVNIKSGEKYKKFKNRKKDRMDNKKSIVDITFADNRSIHLYKGYKNQKKDFIVTYTEDETQNIPRIPKHIHWVVDILLKQQKNKKLTNQFINEIVGIREKSKPISDNHEDTLVTLVNNCVEISDLSTYSRLDEYGKYDIEFLTVLLSLLIVQEKTNYKNPKMLKNIFDKILADDEEFDYYKIISSATYNGR